jgi:phytanoyl-CoA hydroxylase
MTDTIETPPGLTPEQTEQFWRQGYINNIPVLTADQARIALRKFEQLETQAREAAGTQWTESQYSPWTHPRHPVQRWCRAMSTHPRILAAVSAILGPNLLIRNADVFIKEPRNTRRIMWHVDTAAPLEEARLMVTAWLGMTPSTLANGCMDFITGSHQDPLPRGPRDKQSLTFRGSTLERLERLDRVANVMPVGHLSLHCFRTIHRSNGNFTPDRRFGYVTRFVAPSVSAEAAECGAAYVALGDNTPRTLSEQSHFPVSWVRPVADNN